MVEAGVQVKQVPHGSDGRGPAVDPESGLRLGEHDGALQIGSGAGMAGERV